MTRGGSDTEGLSFTGADAVRPVRVHGVDGPGASAEALLERGTLTIGSGGSADLRVDDKAISRQHAVLELLPGAVRVRDLGSRNGTRYLGAKIDVATVPLGGTIQIGRTTFRLSPAALAHAAEATADSPGTLIGNAPPMRKLFARIRRLAAGDTGVLIEGESGSGKEAIARAIHQLGAPGRPFVVFDGAAINANLIESELFGVAKGAFTGADRARAGLLEQATGGTLLLDEVTALPVMLQPRLLRVLESREFRRVGENLVRKASFRVIATSQVPLEQAVARGTFRQDLLFRLAVTRLTVPPLRERREDVAALATHFAAAFAPGHKLEKSTLAAMQCHPWPGNVRELKSAVERALAGLEASPSPAAGAVTASFLEVRQALLSDFERQFLTALLGRHRGNVSAAAREAQLARSFLYKLLEKHGLAS